MHGVVQFPCLNTCGIGMSHEAFMYTRSGHMRALQMGSAGLAAIVADLLWSPSRILEASTCKA